MKTKLWLTIVCFALATSFASAQTTSVNCESLNSIIGTWKKSKFVELKGTLIGTNNDMKFSRFNLKTPFPGALSSEVALYSEATDFNTVDIVLYQETLFTPSISTQFAAIYKSLKLCMKDREEDILSGTSTGLVDGDGQMPEIEFDKDDMPVVTLLIEGPDITQNNYRIILRIESSEDE